MTRTGASDRAVPAKIDPAVWRIVAVVILGTIMAAFDSTIVNIALESLSQDLDSELSQIQWVVSGYLLAMAAVIPLSGWTARRFGAKRMYLATISVFLFGSLLCGLANSTEQLIAFRVLQGAGGGMVMPIGQMIIVKAAGPRNLARVMGVWGAIVLLGPVLGPTVGGLVLDTVSWRWIFFVNIPLGVVAVFLGRRMLPKDAPQEAGPFDALGWLFVAGGSVALTYGLAQVASSGDGLIQVALPVAGGLLLLAAFVVRALRIERPLLDLRLYANKAYRASSVNTFFMGGFVLVGTIILLPLYLQIVRHEDPLHTGLLMAPRGIGTAVAMWLSGRMSERFGPGRTAVTGSVTTIVGTVPLVFLGADTSYVALSVVMLVQGFGIGLAGMPAMTAAFRTLRAREVHDATPQLNMIQRLGASIGAALLIVVLQHQLADAGASASAQAAAFGTTCWILVGASVLALAPTVSLLVLERRHGFELPEADAEVASASVAVLDAN